jgi:hypothetical protein
LNGPELSRFVRRDGTQVAITAKRGEGRLHTRTVRATFDEARRVGGWLRRLHCHLLHKREWEAADKADWAALVTELTRDWQQVSGGDLFPQLHMLTHVLPFVEQHGSVGRYGEARIESYHAQINHLKRVHHGNMGANTVEQLRRCHVSELMRIIQCALLAPASHEQPARVQQPMSAAQI